MVGFGLREKLRREGRHKQKQVEKGKGFSFQKKKREVGPEVNHKKEDPGEDLSTQEPKKK